jgi:hypothetical protein
MILLVVDASVASSCNDPASSDEAANCFLFLQQISNKRNATGVVVNPELDREWALHASRTFTRWLATMETRKRVYHTEERRSRDYRSVVAGVVDDGIRAALEKDIHLVELALFGQYPVASRDDKQRRYVGDLIPEHEVLGAIQWINPVKEDDWPAWFSRGCDRHTFTLAHELS